jgi:molybdenum cofactor cytidylyltransferase
VTVAGVLLAAGAAVRMRRNKLLLELEGDTLLRRAARRALAAGLDPLVVVLGADAARAERELHALTCRAIVNPRPRRGMGTSLAAGVEALPPRTPAAVVLLADMPLVTASMIQALVERHAATGAPAVASLYATTLAPPVLFDRALFSELRRLEGDSGAAGVIRRWHPSVAVVPWPASALADVDVAGDLERARARAGAASASAAPAPVAAQLGDDLRQDRDGDLPR